MNGANADVCANVSNRPNTANTRTIGNSHHFLRTRRNAHISRSNDGRAIVPLLLELPLQVASPTVVALDPSGIRVSERVLADRAHQHAYRGDRTEVDDRHRD